MNLKCRVSLKNVRMDKSAGFLVPRLHAEHWPHPQRSPQSLCTPRAWSRSQFFLEGLEAWWVCVSEVGPQFEQMFDEAEIQEQELKPNHRSPSGFILVFCFGALQPTLLFLSLHFILYILYFLGFIVGSKIKLPTMQKFSFKFWRQRHNC